MAQVNLPYDFSRIMVNAYKQALGQTPLTLFGSSKGLGMAGNSLTGVAGDTISWAGVTQLNGQWFNVTSTQVNPTDQITKIPENEVRDSINCD